MAVREGGCLCGKVRFRLDGEPAMQSVCHCRNCQRQAGSAFAVIVGAASSAVTITGELKTYEDHGDSGGAVLRSFCPNCGAPVVSHIPAAPDFVIIKGGAFDDRWQVFGFHIRRAQHDAGGDTIQLDQRQGGE